MEPFDIIESDKDNPRHNIIVVRGARLSVPKGKEQEAANEYGANKDALAAAEA